MHAPDGIRAKVKRYETAIFKSHAVYDIMLLEAKGCPRFLAPLKPLPRDPSTRLPKVMLLIVHLVFNHDVW